VNAAVENPSRGGLAQPSKAGRPYPITRRPAPLFTGYAIDDSDENELVEFLAQLIADRAIERMTIAKT
jgi:hypothetical protein